MKCPFCAEDIKDEAVKCRFCGEWLTKDKGKTNETPSFSWMNGYTSTKPDSKPDADTSKSTAQAGYSPAAYQWTTKNAPVATSSALSNVTNDQAKVCGCCCGLPVILFIAALVWSSNTSPQEQADARRNVDNINREWHQGQIKNEIDDKIRDAQDRGDKDAEQQAQYEMYQLNKARQEQSHENP